MPIFRIDRRLYFFFHVPKCAGTAVENYLAQRFGPLAMLDRDFLKIPSEQRWNLTSPQHADAATLQRFFPSGYIENSFAVVRHPVDRIVSVFRFQRDVEKLLPGDTDFVAWLADLPRHGPFYLDNHVRPMTDLVPPGVKIFRLEDGLDQVVLWLDSLAGHMEGPREIERNFTYWGALERKGRQQGAPVTVTDAAREMIARSYAADFERFDYSSDTIWRGVPSL